MSGREATTEIRPGARALSVGSPDLPLPAGWAWAPLDLVARLESGHTPRRDRAEYWENADIRWMTVADARPHDGGVIFETAERINELGLANSAARLLPANTVCLSRTGSIGYVVRLGQEMATTQGFVNWVCGEHLNPKYLQYLLRSERNALIAFSEGTAHTTIYYPELKAFHVALPPLREQLRMVEQLDAIFERSRATKERLARVPALLDKLKRSILAAAFRGDLTQGWRNSEAGSADLRAVRDALGNGVPLPPGAQRGRKQARAIGSGGAHITLPALPSSWMYADVRQLYDAGLLVDFADGNHGSDYPRAEDFGTDGVPFVTASQVTDNGDVLLGEAPCLSTSKASSLRKGWARGGDILLTHNATVGRVALVPTDVEPFLLGTSATYYRTNPLWIEPAYLAGYFRSAGWQAQLERVMKQTTRNQVSIQRQEPLLVAIPPLAEQMRIATIVTAFLELLAGLDIRVREAMARPEAIERAVLAKAFRGELVPQDPNDEPASVLLERIRASRPAAVPERAPRRSPAGTNGGQAAAKAKRPHATAAAPSPPATLAGDGIPAEMVLSALHAASSMAASDVAAATGLEPPVVKKAIKQLVEAGQVRMEGKKRGARYVAE